MIPTPHDVGLKNAGGPERAPPRFSFPSVRFWVRDQGPYSGQRPVYLRDQRHFERPLPCREL